MKIDHTKRREIEATHVVHTKRKEKINLRNIAEGVVIGSALILLSVYFHHCFYTWADTNFSACHPLLKNNI